VCSSITSVTNALLKPHHSGEADAYGACVSHDASEDGSPSISKFASGRRSRSPERGAETLAGLRDGS
jgi:hypothetical protein